MTENGESDELSTLMNARYPSFASLESVILEYPGAQFVKYEKNLPEFKLFSSQLVQCSRAGTVSVLYVHLRVKPIQLPSF